ncbi:Retrovirus-related Pol polyprotein from transposon RE1 [Vitis vinifera]|uniref:Retrovirus-related Pol polyprotein from transposon RE1 n=1 Tax=Vitis vinifera TaxID=29760 RepID=A0A438HTR1_VITVI|nr:Retrovirus-related Pol polyprotein from transposon RE1 [Vitis vinifera]
MITSEKLVGSENYLSWSASVELWFMGQGYEDHLVTQQADIPEAKGLYTNDIQRLYKVASAIVHISQQDLDLSTLIGQIATLKEEFLTVMLLLLMLGLNKHSLTSSSWSLLLLASVQILSPSVIRFLVVHQFRPWMMCLLASSVSRPLRLCHLIALQILLLHGRPPHTAHMAQSSDSPLPQPPSSSASQTSQAFIASVAQPGNASTYLTHTSSLGPWILDSGASDHLSGNKDLFSSITTTSALPTVTLANGSQTVAKGIGLALPLPSLSLTSVLYTPECPFNLISISKLTRTLNCSITFSDKFVTLQDRSTGKTIGIGRESQGLYHLTSDSSAAICISTYAPLLIHNRLVTMPGYFSAPFTSFMSHHGILHQSSCAHTPQQNGDKLSAKAMKCLFLGYSRLQKGYRCYSLETHRYFISADVTFFEDSPFFSTTSESLPVSEVLPIPIVSPPDAILDHFSSAFFPDDLPIAIRKGWRQAWWMKWLLYTLMALGILLFYPLVDRLKARLVAKGYTQVYGSDYGDTFSHVAKIASVRLLLSMAAMCSWSLYQLDIKNAFLHGDLVEEVYMEQPPGFVAQGESGLVCRLRRSLYSLKQSPRAWFGHFSSVVQEFGMLRSTTDHSVFYHYNSLGQCIYLVVFVDDIIITGSDQDDSSIQFQCGLSQRKYALDILEETGMLDCKPVDTPMDPNVKLVPGQGEPLGDPGRYRRLVGKLNYLTITRPDISFPVSVVSQFLQSPCDSHWDAVIRILRYIKSTPGQGVLYKNRGHTQNKKQDVVARSSAEAEYRAMALATCELIWLRHLLQELRFGKDEQMKLICDNQAALHIASNPVFHERTKHIEVDCHFIREKIASGCVATSFVNSNDQLADIFTKSLRGTRIKYICNKLGAYDIYASA